MPDDLWRDFAWELFDSPARAPGNARLKLRPPGLPSFRFTEEEKIIMESKTDPKAQAEMRAAEQKVAAEALAARIERDRADDRAMAGRAEAEIKRVEAERVRIADAETASQRAAMRAPAATPAAEAVRQSAMPSTAHPRAALKLWTLRPKDRNEPPFFFVGTVQDYTVLATSEKQARALAAGNSSVHFAAWRDEALTECFETDMTKPRVIARDMGV